MTYTEIINKVLIKLRESEIASPNDSTYSKLIGQFVNETKREVEDAWKWSVLKQTITVAVTSGTTSYSVTGSGDRYKLQDPTNSIWEQTEEYYLTPISAIKGKEIINSADQSSRPSYYYFEGVDGSGDSIIKVAPTPDSSYTIYAHLIVPQEDFSLGTEVLSVPEYPVILGAYSKAVAERGEDSGRTSGEAEQMYRDALSDAIAIDEGRSIPQENSWHV